MIKNNGFFAIPRSLEDDPYFQSLTFSERYIVVDLISRAEWEEKKILVNNEIFTIKPGQFCTSQRELHEIYKEHFKSLSGFQYFLQKVQNRKIFLVEKIGRSCGHQRTLLTVIHPDICEVNFGNKRSQIRSPFGRHSVATHIITKPSNHLTNEEKINKKEKVSQKKSYREFVFLTEEEFAKLSADHPPDFVNAMLDELNSYKGSTGKEYKSDYHTMTGAGWVLKKVKSPPQQSSHSQGKPQVDRRTQNQDGTPVSSPADDIF